MEFFKQLDDAPRGRSADTVIAEIDSLIEGGWEHRKSEIADLMAELRRDHLLLRNFMRKVTDQDEWPELQGAQSYTLHASSNCVVRVNLWFAPMHGNPALDTFRRYLSVEELHNHDFRFFTTCLLGPGYRTHFYLDEDWSPKRQAGDSMKMRDLGEHRLSGADVLFVERDVDYHLQHWPEDFSITLNVIPADPPGASRVQYILDSETLAVRFVARS